MRKPISAKLRHQILTRDNYTCQCCGARAPNITLHVDHITAVANGGASDPTNLQSLCITCNFGKSDTDSVVVLAKPLHQGPIIAIGGADEVRCRGEALSEPIFWIGHKWAVTAFGIEHREGTYPIAKERLWKHGSEYSWKQHIRNSKTNDWANWMDFDKAFDFAETHFSSLKPDKQKRA